MPEAPKAAPAPVTTGPSVIGVPAAPEAKPALPAIPVFTEQTYDQTGVRAPKAAETPAESGEPAQNPADEATAAQAEGETPTGEPPEQRTGKNRYERRLDKAYRRAAEAQARAELLEKQLAESRPKEQQQLGAPRLEDFTDVQEYAKAYGKWESQQAVKKYETDREQQQFSRSMQKLSVQWEDKASRADRKYDDFDDVVGELVPNNPVAIAIMQAENGEDIAYYLGTHLKEAARIAQLDPLSQAREIGRLETKLLTEPPKAKTPSKAPAPIVPLAGKSGAASDEPLDTDDINTWMKKANAKSRKAIGA